MLGSMELVIQEGVWIITGVNVSELKKGHELQYSSGRVAFTKEH
jgi:hypothetical protein